MLASAERYVTQRQLCCSLSFTPPTLKERDKLNRYPCIYVHDDQVLDVVILYVISPTPASRSRVASIGRMSTSKLGTQPGLAALHCACARGPRAWFDGQPHGARPCALSSACSPRSAVLVIRALLRRKIISRSCARRCQLPQERRPVQIQVHLRTVDHVARSLSCRSGSSRCEASPAVFANARPGET